MSFPMAWRRGNADMKCMIVVAGLFSINGCLALRPDETVIDENTFQGAFGSVPIIQRGMSVNDVDRLVGDFSKSGMCVGSIAHMMWWHSCGLSFDTYAEKVISCSCSNLTISGPDQKETIADGKLATMLSSGLTPKEVEAKIGGASCGFCMTPGTVNLLYMQPGIEVVFVGERLLRWRRCVTYKDEPISKAP